MSGERPSTARLPAAERRRQLLDVAMGRFAADGFHHTSMNDLAEAAGVTKPVLYQHFASKRELYLELLREVGGRMGDAIAKATADAEGPRQQVEAGFTAYFSWVDANRQGFDILFAGETRRDREFANEALSVEAQIANGIADQIVVEGLSSERRMLLAYAIVGISETTCRHWLANELDLSPRELARQVADLAWAGLRGLRPA